MRDDLRSRLSRMAVLVVIWIVGCLPLIAQTNPPGEPRKSFPNSVIPLEQDHTFTLHKMDLGHQGDGMDLLFSLANRADLRAAVEKKVALGKRVSEDEIKAAYSVSEADLERLEAWLKFEGFEITYVSSDRTSVYARGTVRQIEKSLNVAMVRVTREGQTYNATGTVPSLPESVGTGVRAIIGLQPFRHAQKHVLKMSVADWNAAPVPHPSPAAKKAPYGVRALRGAYDGAELPWTGAGQTIAILIDTWPKDSDLVQFWKVNGLPESTERITKINVGGLSLPLPTGEETLDAEWASGLAPEAKIRIYASGSLGWVDIDHALDRIIEDASKDPTLRQVSISLGLGETYMTSGPGSELEVEHAKFLLLAARGVNVFVSSGDAGSNPDESGHRSGGPLQAEYQSSDPCVVGVGGTTLTLSALGSVESEEGWTAGGGGLSRHFDRPPWQTASGVPTSGRRRVPDVSCVADPVPGALIVFQEQTASTGGTSWSAPVWAAVCALINEARVKAGKEPLDFLNPIIYPLSGTESFRDIVVGSNGKYSAGPGHDMVTGIGVPRLARLVEALTR